MIGISIASISKYLAQLASNSVTGLLTVPSTTKLLTATVLLGLAAPVMIPVTLGVIGIQAATEAVAADGESPIIDYLGQPVLTSDLTGFVGKLDFYPSNDNNGRELEYGGSLPAGERFAPIGYDKVPALFFDETSSTQKVVLTNTTAEPFTVENFEGVIADHSYTGDSETVMVIPVGTSIMDTEVSDFVVPANDSVTVSFTTTTPLVSVVRLNDDGRISGAGYVARFTASVNGHEYWIEEVSGFGSAFPDSTGMNPNPQDATTDIFESCTKPDPISGLPMLDICFGAVGNSVSVYTSYLNTVFVPEVPPVVVIPDEPVVIPEPTPVPEVTPEPVVTPDPVVIPEPVQPVLNPEHPKTGTTFTLGFILSGFVASFLIASLGVLALGVKRKENLV